MWNKWLRSREFLDQLVWKRKPEPIRTPLLIWAGMPNDLLTLILQRTILGAESYIPAAVWMELGRSGRLTQELNRVLKNPFLLKVGKKAAFRYYNAVPSLLDPAHALQTANAALWDDVKEFYETVRNKILHGYQIGDSRPEALYPCLDMFNSVYAWAPGTIRRSRGEGAKRKPDSAFFRAFRSFLYYFVFASLSDLRYQPTKQLCPRPSYLWELRERRS